MKEQKLRSYNSIPIAFLFYIFIFSGCLFGIPHLYKAPANSDFKYYGITPVIDSISSLKTKGIYACEIIYKDMLGKIFYEFQIDGKVNLYGYYPLNEPNIEIANKIDLKLLEPDYFGYFIVKKDTLFLEYVFPEKTAAVNAWYQMSGRVHSNGDSIRIFKSEKQGKYIPENIDRSQNCYFIKL